MKQNITELLTIWNVINFWHVSYRYDITKVPGFISQFSQKKKKRLIREFNLQVQG